MTLQVSLVIKYQMQFCQEVLWKIQGINLCKSKHELANGIIFIIKNTATLKALYISHL